MVTIGYYLLALYKHGYHWLLLIIITQAWLPLVTTYYPYTSMVTIGCYLLALHKHDYHWLLLISITQAWIPLVTTY